MSWLARITLPEESPILKEVKDDYQWHQKLWLCYENEPEHKRDFLFRRERQDDAVVLWIKGEKKPTCPSWCPRGDFSVKEIAAAFLDHRFYAFDLLANPTKTLLPRKADGMIDRGPDEKKRPRGKRIPLRTKKDLKAWIEKKATASGFKLTPSDRLEIHPPTLREMEQKGKNLSLTAVRFQGFLEVIDQTAFSKAYQQGIGTAKGLGFGLLLLAPINTIPTSKGE